MSVRRNLTLGGLSNHCARLPDAVVDTGRGGKSVLDDPTQGGEWPSVRQTRHTPPEDAQKKGGNED